KSDSRGASPDSSERRWASFIVSSIDYSPATAIFTEVMPLVSASDALATRNFLRFIELPSTSKAPIDRRCSIRSDVFKTL
ncbi:MAG: hypothetical protein AAF550_14150, partial [Myxococcota bacterium]